MDLREVMQQDSFVIVGDTLNEEKYAHIIKHAMIDDGYRVQCVGKELASLNDTEGDIDVIDLCIRADRGLELMKHCKKPFKSVVIQPGASSPELTAYLKEKNIPFIDACLLVGLKVYKRER